MTTPVHNFQVDLAGIVELLSTNLYSGPTVFVRELLQNGLDAITARQDIDPDCPTRMRFILGETTLTIIDTGIGLTLEDAEQLLSTIGASSKKDEWGMARQDFLGQFGIGLLSCFMVSSTIEVYSRSARTPNPDTIVWSGHAGGTWSVRQAAADTAPTQLPEAGTAVVLTLRPGDRLNTIGVLGRLIEHYGRYLPLDVTVERASDSFTSSQLCRQPAPFEMRSRERDAWCASNFGFNPLDSFTVDVPAAGLVGVAYIVDGGVAPGSIQNHRVYLRRMLLGDNITNLLPPWAYFVRLVIDSDQLKPTASREQLFDDELLADTREALGAQIRDWLNTLADSNPEKFSRFAAAHIQGLKSLAIADRDTRDLIARTVPFSTTVGSKTLDAIIEEYGAVRYCPNDTQFRTIEPVAAANGLCIINAGYAFDEQLLGQYALDRPQARISALDIEEIIGVLDPLDIADEAALLPLKALAERALAGQNITVEIRSFEPTTLPVLFLPDADIAGRVISTQSKDTASGPFAGLVDAMDKARSATSASRGRGMLVFNAHATIVYELAGKISDEEIVFSAIRGFYVQALLAGRHPMNAQARSWSTSVFSTLIARCLST
ncbi:HSP90 family protein [Corynebacterium aquilae]|uniref:Molecular chaperone Hsp90 n=1 Tax=Corynebacterium aquilae DSM 44791 TaxID=1431546 RepID=A0A1L7CGY5_9CORY|nr:HSP90 family protein [Corynebacterium aquilae]APT85107.1 hypothetical protein CAQU_08530 [Corynebacterium aquilae DSM 44791]